MSVHYHPFCPIHLPLKRIHSTMCPNMMLSIIRILIFLWPLFWVFQLGKILGKENPESNLKWSESESRSVMSSSLQPHGLCSPWDSPGQNTGVGSLSLLQGIFPTQGSNPGLPHCRWILYQLSHKGSLRILGWVANPFSSRFSWPRDPTQVSCIAGGFFTNWAMSEAHFREESKPWIPSLGSLETGFTRFSEALRDLWENTVSRMGTKTASQNVSFLPPNFHSNHGSQL